MKTFLAIIMFLFCLSNVIGQTNLQTFYSITGKLSNWNGKFIYLSCKGIGISRVWDSTVVENDSFKFSGELTEPSNGFITVLTIDRVKNLKDKNITERLFISPSKMTIELVLDSFQQGKMHGSKYQDQYQLLENSKKKLYHKIELLSALSDSLSGQKNDIGEPEKSRIDIRLDSIEIAWKSLWSKCSKIDKVFFAQHPNSYVTSYLLKEYYSGLSLEQLKNYYNRMLPSTQKWEYGVKLKDAISTLQKGSAGSVATDFSGVDIKGDSLSLSQYRGKYVLLDFWASWCMPCRAGNPELIRLYKRYKSQGIEFIGIAADNGSEDKWKAAIEKDHINIWRHILDKKIGELYAVNTIPLQILIDPKGRIIGRFEAGRSKENISNVLKKLFGN